MGYAPVYAEAAAARAEARADARRAMGRALQLRVRAEQGYEQHAGSAFAARGEHVRETPLPDSLVTAVFLDSLETTRMTLILAATASVPVSDTRAAMHPEAPVWTRVLPAAWDTLYALGVAPAYYYEHKGWREAERHGRVQLAFQAQAQVRRLDRAAAGTGTSVAAVATDVTLSGVHVVARWRNDRTCYVLMRAIPVALLDAP